jgi:hypothetical protein
MKKALFPLMIILVLTGCNTAKHPAKALKNLAFLQGNWQYEDQGVQVIEKWNSADGSMNGTSLLILKGDTVFQENIKVSEIDGKVMYKSTMGKYVVEDLKTLPLTRCTAKRAVFGNMNQTNSVYICYSFKRGKLFVEMRDIVDGKVIHDKYGLEKIN